MTRDELVEQVAKIIAGPDARGQADEETWREWTVEAEQIVDLLRPDKAMPEQSTGAG